MSGDYDNTNRGALFKNDKEGGNPKWPDYRGSINVNGEEFWLDAWLQKAKKTGATFMSLKIKPKKQDGQRTTQNEPARVQDNPTDFDDDIPF